jgi:protein CpxP
MKRIADQLIHPAALAVAVTLLSFTVLATATPSRAASTERAPAAVGAASRGDRVEARIKDLHAKLSITPAQEELWGNVTQVMRDNAKTMETLIKARSAHMMAMSAVDDLKSYSEIAEAHADGLKKFVPAFEPLYVSMSDTQKKNADALFHHHGRVNTKAKGK